MIIAYIHNNRTGKISTRTVPTPANGAQQLLILIKAHGGWTQDDAKTLERLASGERITHRNRRYRVAVTD